MYTTKDPQAPNFEDFVSDMSTEYAALGEAYTSFRCRPSGAPVPVVTWTWPSDVQVRGVSKNF
jgi:hypothetical protein